jgi:hypothetical protein
MGEQNEMQVGELLHKVTHFLADFHAEVNDSLVLAPEGYEDEAEALLIVLGVERVGFVNTDLQRFETREEYGRYSDWQPVYRLGASGRSGS